MQQISSIYLKIADNARVFTPVELGVLREVLLDINVNSNSTYKLVEEKEGERVAGFAVLGRIPMTAFGWDIYWMAIDKDLQGKGIGTRLLRRVEALILSAADKAIVRVETSARKDYVLAQNFYCKRGFIQAGIIPDFYGTCDDLMVFYKKITNRSLKFGDFTDS
ncbi:MAG: GNAT family N-acetyltransferase [Candidatus Omnitrophica bacterium]|nr:GNAT family N-acetyltransferase [Candidatus Omnitrophota bacterium]MDD5429679.1 GNAT family N-acetyltransferase [Candidatus Omnitrophota bacterium]